jgi:hypothetical protein
MIKSTRYDRRETDNLAAVQPILGQFETAKKHFE